MDQCPTCGKPYGKRKRCYGCQPGRKRTGETRSCQQCGTEFYAETNQIADTGRNSATFCSRACKGAARQGKPGFTGRPDDKTYHSAGYVLVWAPDHPRATPTHKRVFEHILVLEQKLGRYLEAGEFVHHRDGNRTNNDPANLELVDNPGHAQLHAKTNPYCQPRDRRLINCQECGVEFEVKRYQAESDDPQARRKYCSLACRHAAWARQMVAKRAALRGKPTD